MAYDDSSGLMNGSLLPDLVHDLVQRHRGFDPAFAVPVRFDSRESQVLKSGPGHSSYIIHPMDDGPPPDSQ